MSLPALLLSMARLCAAAPLPAPPAEPAPRQELAAARGLFAQGRYADVERLLAGGELERLRSADLRLAYDLLGQSQDRIGSPDKALGTYQVGVALFPKDINLLTHLAGLLHREGLDDRARPFYERALKIHPHNTGSHLDLAEIDRATGFLERAAGHYELALKELADAAPLWRDLGEIRAKRGDYAGAIAAAERSLALNKDVDTMLDLARFQYSAGRSSAATVELLEAEKAAPKRFELVLQHALWLLDASDFDGAKQLAQQVHRQVPDQPLALWILAQAALRDGDIDGATQLFVRAASQGEAPFVASVAQTMLILIKR